MRTHSHYVPYNQTYFAGLIFTVRQSSAKTTKIRPHNNFPLYSIPLSSHANPRFVMLRGCCFTKNSGMTVPMYRCSSAIGWCGMVWHGMVHSTHWGERWGWFWHTVALRDHCKQYGCQLTRVSCSSVHPH